MATRKVTRTRSKRVTETILEEAQRITGNGGERNDSYDHPYPNFSKIAGVWSILLGITITPAQVGQLMIGMKLVRESHKGKRDNLVDLAGYARTIERLDEWDVVRGRVKK